MHDPRPLPPSRSPEVFLSVLDEQRLRQVVGGELAAVLEAFEARLVERLSPTAISAGRENSDEFLTERDVAALLKCHVRTVRRLEQRGELPRALRIGGSKRFRRRDVADWLGKETNQVRRSA